MQSVHGTSGQGRVKDRPWFLFQLPLPPGVVASRCYVQADTEAEAREKLARESYKGAPVHEWPCLGSRWCARERLFG